MSLFAELFSHHLFLVFAISCILTPEFMAQQPSVQVPLPEVVPAVNDPVIAPRELRSYEAQLERRIHVESAFLRRIVQLSPEQEQQLASVTVKSLELNRINDRRVAPGIEFQTRLTVNGMEVIDPLQMRRLERAIDKAMIAILNDEQKIAYKIEMDKRIAFERNVTTDGILLILNRKLGLTDHQRTLIRSKLANWSELGGVVIDFYLAKDYFPPIPPEMIVPVLDEKQRSVYDASSKTQIFSWPNPFVPGDVKIDR